MGKHTTVRVSNTNELPCKGQTFEQVEKWVDGANLKIGDTVAIRKCYAGMYEYRLTKIDEIKYTKAGRVSKFVVELGADFLDRYYRSGKSYHYPTGQTHLIEPTEPVMKAANERTMYWPGGPKLPS